VTATSNTAFEQAKRLFVEGNRHVTGGRWPEAKACFAASLQWLPGRPSTLMNLAIAHIRLGEPEAALPLLAQVLAAEPGNADAWCQQGIALSDLNRHAEALPSLERAIALAPTHGAARFHRGIALNVLRRHEAAHADFAWLVQQQADNAEAWFRHGQTLQALGRHAEAQPAYERALALDDTIAQAWSNLGGIHKDARRIDAAASCYERAIEHGADRELHRWYLASLRAEATPGKAPKAYLEALFDDYADQFDSHLLKVLRYRAPTVLAEAIGRAQPQGFGSALDLGCGTGLVAPLLKGAVPHIDGVDLSQRMLDKARALGLYDRLVKAEVVEHLLATERRYDLVLSADVVPYLGELEPLFAAVRRVIEPGGVFAFSAERAEPTERFVLRASMRYAHGEAYLRGLAAQHGFATVELLQQVLREDAGQPIEGLYLVLRAATRRSAARLLKRPRPGDQRTAARPTPQAAPPLCRPSLRSTVSSGHSPVSELCARLSPTKAVSQSQWAEWNNGLAAAPSASDTRITMPANRRMTFSICMVFPAMLWDDNGVQHDATDASRLPHRLHSAGIAPRCRRRRSLQ
jgi:predicted TPR repeat methyltransferase